MGPLALPAIPIAAQYGLAALGGGLVGGVAANAVNKSKPAVIQTQKIITTQYKTDPELLKIVQSVLSDMNNKQKQNKDNIQTYYFHIYSHLNHLKRNKEWLKQHNSNSNKIIVLQYQRSQRALVFQLKDTVRQLQKAWNEAEKQGKKCKDPAVYKKLKEKAFITFLEHIKTYKFQEKIPRLDGHKYMVLIGNISSGKSSLINSSCGTMLPVGLGQVTQYVQQVANSQDGLVHIYDSPGVNEDFKYYDVQVLAYFRTADRIFILYPDSLKSSKEMIQVLNEIKPTNTFLVRTMCDRCEKGHTKTIEQELKTDRELLKSWNIKMQVLGTSTKKNLDFLDNKRFQKLLHGEQ